ncbi:hypothetical protein [uncultured Tenacibaculum sp.]|uniref:hypothetical protein n=1 Tax=uncultured Tenacibaculum sp. TaxID=174713 RepID=UPI0026367FCE|nr:hypothetical protein [uncultured Tenacibaculum sp.]
MSVRKEIYQSVASKLDAIGTFTLIDLYKGQFDEEDSNGLNRFPAAYISIGSITYQDMVLDVLEGGLQLDVYIFFKQDADTEVGASNQETSLAILSTIDDVVEAIQKTSGNYFTDLTQIAEEDLTPTYKRPAYKVTFSTNIYKKVGITNYILN